MDTLAVEGFLGHNIVSDVETQLSTRRARRRGLITLSRPNTLPVDVTAQLCSSWHKLHLRVYILVTRGGSIPHRRVVYVYVLL